METELKYRIDNKDTADIICTDPYLISIEEEDSRESLCMKAAYFDTEDHILSQNDIAFRVRQEGTRVIASLKWNGVSKGALHTREELNVPVPEECSLINPKPELFKESEIGEHLLDLIGGKPLLNIMEMRFLRKRLRVDTGKAIMEISVDKGGIVGDVGELPLCEVEIELFSGDEEELLVLGEKLAEKYGLIPEDRSKYARGLEFLRK